MIIEDWIQDWVCENPFVFGLLLDLGRVDALATQHRLDLRFAGPRHLVLDGFSGLVFAFPDKHFRLGNGFSHGRITPRLRGSSL